eukprot:6190243-Pleurochrysis_carterae.AAC.2
MDVEPEATVRAKLCAALSLHCPYYTHEACLELLVTLHGLAVCVRGAKALLRLAEGAGEKHGDNDSLARAVAREAAQTAGADRVASTEFRMVGKAVLLIQPPFRAWLNLSKARRVTLVFEFKVVVMHKSGHFDWPPNCMYPEAAARRTQAVPLKSLKEMKERRFPLSTGLLQLLSKAMDDLPATAAAQPMSSSAKRRKVASP